MSEKRRPPLIITEEHDWGQYRLFVIDSVTKNSQKLDHLEQRVNTLAIKVAVVTALAAAVASVGTQLLMKAIGG
jgi:hypothetical protein